jgi:high-affinity iron transporter
MIASFLIALREGIEAVLIVAVILSYLRKIDAMQLARPVYVGTILGIIGSVAVGALFLLLSVEFQGTGEQVFEGSTMLLAAAILTTMIFWMSRNSKEYSEDLKSKVQKALTTKQSYGLAGLAFVSIIREGIETVLFLGSTSFTATGIQTLIGGSLGLLFAVLIGVGIIRYSVRLNMKSFFNATGVLLVFFAAGLVANGLGEFGEAGVIPPVVEHVWNSNWLVNGNSNLGNLLWALFGYNAEPSLAQILGYILYWILVAAWIYKDQTTLAYRRILATVRPE